MCYNGPGPGDTEEEAEAVSPWEHDADESWRGDRHLGDWPEILAGPEYWLRKKELEADPDIEDDGA